MQSLNDFNGVDRAINKRRTTKSEFQDRFKGKTALMNKEGHIGVVTKTQQPISKMTGSDLAKSQLYSRP